MLRLRHVAVRGFARGFTTTNISTASFAGEFSAAFDREVRMESYGRFAALKRAEYEPQGLQESLEHPPPFSRSFLLVMGGFSVVTVGAGLLSASPGIVAKLACYHLRLSVLSLLYFTGEDFAYGVLARTQPWAHRSLPVLGVVALGLAQLIVATEILTEDGLGEDPTSVYPKIGGLLALHVAGSLVIFKLPLWARVWRGFMLAGIGVSLPVMMSRRLLAEANRDALFL